MIKAIFWDNDGVLVDTECLYFQATQEMLATVGIELTRELFIEHSFVQGKGLWFLAEQRGIQPDTIEELRTKRNVRYGELLSQDNLLIEGAKDTVEALRGHYTMGIVTSCRKDHFEIIHQSTNLLHNFDFILAGGDYARYKPEPDPYLKALEQSGFQTDECMVIEDSARGLIAARKAGLQCIVIPTELTRGSDFQAAYAVLNMILELPEALITIA